MRSRLALALASCVLLSGAACSSTADSPPGSPSPSTEPPGPAVSPAPEGPPVVRFFLGAAGSEHEVQEIIYGEQVVVRVSNLAPGTDVVVRAQSHHSYKEGRAYVSHATYRADAHGVVDTRTAAPKEGTYDGADPDGLLWSMVEAAPPKGLGSDPYAVTFLVDIGGEVKAEKSLPRRAFAKGVKCRDVNDDGLVGYYCTPPGGEKRTPVLAFGGSEGGLFSGSWDAMSFASWGVPTLGVAYFNAPGLPKDLSKIPLEYFAKAMDWLDRQPEVRTGKTVVAGGSRGGELALLLGATYPRISAVIADVPSAFVWSSTTGSGAAWTLAGVDLPAVPSARGAEPEFVTGPDGKDAYKTTPVFLADIAKASAAALDAATIRVEKIGGPVLMLAGEDDALWPSCEFTKRVMARLTSAGHVAMHGDEAKCYPDAGHAVSFVGSPTTDAMWAEIGDSGWFALGGTAKGIHAAKRDADTKRHVFLEKVTK